LPFIYSLLPAAAFCGLSRLPACRAMLAAAPAVRRAAAYRHWFALRSATRGWTTALYDAL